MIPFNSALVDAYIRKNIESNAVFQKGIMLYLSHLVNMNYYEAETGIFMCHVHDGRSYQVKITVAPDGEVLDTKCSCSISKSDFGICHHVVGAFKKIYDYARQTNASIIQSQRNSVKIFDMITYQDKLAPKQELEVNVTCCLTKYSTRSVFELELKIGLPSEKKYVVKNIEEFLHNLKTGAHVEFGKKFVFNQDIHTFSEYIEQVFELIVNTMEYNDLMRFREHENYYRNSGITQNGVNSSKRRVALTDTNVKRFLNISKKYAKVSGDTGQVLLPFGIEVPRFSIPRCEMKSGCVPISFKISESAPHFVVDIYNISNVQLLTSDGQYVFFEGVIYEMDSLTGRNLAGIYKIAQQIEFASLLFDSQHKDRLVSELMPMMQSLGDVDVSPDIEDSIIREELSCRVYFDRNGQGIKGLVEFCYGNHVLNPFEARREHQSNKILVRDVQKERCVLGIFEQANFRVGDGNVYLDVEDEIFDFIHTQIPVLQEYSEIFYSEDFKTLRIKEKVKFSGGIHLNEDSNLLEFNFQFNDIPPQELDDIFRSIQQKKKYYRLKDGAFIPLDDNKLIDIGTLLSGLDLTGKDFSDGTVNLPSYRAMYIDSHLRESDLWNVERNLSFKQLVQNIKEPEDMDFKVPPDLKNVLREYQKVGFKWLMTLAGYRMGGILADDMGLGKTLQVIAFVESRKSNKGKPALVIAPTSLLYNWQDEVNKFTQNLQTLIVSGQPQERQQLMNNIEESDIVITSYPLICRDIDIYKKFQFSYCFIDEAQHIKNPNTLTAKSVKQIKADGYFALTGTPIENSLTELWSIFDFIMPGYLYNHTKFKKKCETPISRNHDTGALEDLKRHIKPFILRRMKTDVLKELPQKIEYKMSAGMTDGQRKLYLAYLSRVRSELQQELAQNGFEKSQIRILAMLTRLRQICCHPSTFAENYHDGSGKMELLQEVLEEAVASGHRILLFSQFTSMLGIIKEYLRNANISHMYLDGSTKSSDRMSMVKEFNNGNCSVFLISLKAGGTGLNLTGADTVIHFDPWWNPAVEDQATDRAYRIGQKNIVQVIKLVTQGTIEEKIFELQKKKKEMIDAVIQPGETLISKMTQKEILGLFDIDS